MAVAPSRAHAQALSAEAAYAGVDEAALARLRNDFAEADASMAATLDALARLEETERLAGKPRPAILQAYRASLTGLRGKHARNLVDKWNLVTEAIDQYEGLVERHPGSLELRFMRYAFFSQLPAIFGVGRYVEPDLAELLRLLESSGDARVSRTQRADMIGWLITEGGLSAAERSRLSAVRGSP